MIPLCFQFSKLSERQEDRRLQSDIDKKVSIGAQIFVNAAEGRVVHMTEYT
jgi:hypothetical protein